MKNLKQFILTILACLILQYFLPWWTLVIAAFAGGYVYGTKAWVSFLTGFLAVALLWLIMAMTIDAQTSSVLTEKVARMFPTKTPAMLFLLTAIVGGLPGGFAAMSGTLLKVLSR